MTGEDPLGKKKIAELFLRDEEVKQGIQALCSKTNITSEPQLPRRREH